MSPSKVMNSNLPDDGVSAFFDGELSPEEEPDIRQQIAHSPEAQRELVEMRQISRELRELTEASAPSDLLKNVLAEMDHAEASVNRRASFSIGTAAKWVSAVAAIGVAAVWLPRFWDRDSDRAADSSIALNAPEESNTGGASADFADPIRDNMERPTATQTRQSIPLANDGATKAKEQNATRKKITALSATPGRLLAPQDPQMQGPALERGETDELEKQSAQVVNDSGLDREEIMVIELAAADVPQAMAELRLRLAEQSIGPADKTRRAQAETLAEKSSSNSDAASSAKALYVQATPIQLQAAISELRRSSVKTSRRMASSERAFGDAWNERGGLGGQMGGGNARGGGRSLTKDRFSNKNAAAFDAGKPASKRMLKKPSDEEAPAERRSFATSGIQVRPQAEIDEAANPVDAFQMLVPESAFAPASPQEPAEAEAAENRGRKRTAPDEESKKSDEVKTAKTAPRVVRYLFLFRPARDSSSK